MNRVWTAEDKAEVERRWLAGETSGEIAKPFGVSRNAVIGVINRLGIDRPEEINRRNRGNAGAAHARPDSTRALKRERAARAQEKPSKPVSLKAAPIILAPRPAPAPVRPMGASVGTMDLRSGDCCWPLWQDSRTTPMALKFYCAQPAIEGQSWCKAHSAVVYRPKDRVHPFLRDALKLGARAA